APAASKASAPVPQRPAPPAAAAPSGGPAPDLSDLPAWANVMLKKGEELVGVRESSGSSIGTAVLVAVSVIISGAAGIANDMIGGMPIAAGAVGVICVTVFIAAILLGKKGSRRALVVTNQRAISVVGKDRLEVKQ
ncbi:MAG: hypothetical protein JW808_06995, partial [Victivallales bacterium]|nr:hypothetical protein [Victivallales bacterium]